MDTGFIYSSNLENTMPIIEAATTISLELFFIFLGMWKIAWWIIISGLAWRIIRWRSLDNHFTPNYRGDNFEWVLLQINVPDDNEVPRIVAHDLQLEFFPTDKTLFDQDGIDRAFLQAEFYFGGKILITIGDAATAATECERGA